MKNIYGAPGTGKTKELLEFASEQGAVVVCKNPQAMLEKIRCYNLPVMHCVSYLDFVSKDIEDPCVIDDVESFISMFPTGNKVIGFTSLSE